MGIHEGEAGIVYNESSKRGNLIFKMRTKTYDHSETERNV